MSKIFKELQTGNTLYVLVKADQKLTYEETTVISVSAPRTEMPQTPQFPVNSAFKQVVDITYSVGGKTYTDTADVTASMLQSGAVTTPTLVATEKDFVLNELKETLKQSEKWVKDVDKHKKRIKDCKTLISELDTEFKEREATENRLSKLEETSQQTNDMLRELIQKMKDNKLF